MTSPTTNRVWPSANRYQGDWTAGFQILIARTIATGEENAMRLKSQPCRKPGANRNARSMLELTDRYRSHARRYMRSLSVGERGDLRGTSWDVRGVPRGASGLLPPRLSRPRGPSRPLQ